MNVIEKYEILEQLLSEIVPKLILEANFLPKFVLYKLETVVYQNSELPNSLTLTEGRISSSPTRKTKTDQKI